MLFALRQGKCQYGINATAAEMESMSVKKKEVYIYLLNKNRK